MLRVMSREDYREPAAVETRSARRFRHPEIWITARADCSICVDDNLSTMRPLGFVRPRLAFGFAIVTSVVLTMTTASSAASRVWDWNFSNSEVTASGTFMTAESPDSSGGYLIDAITGMRNGQVITGLQAPGTSIPGNEPYVVDDLVFLGPRPQLSGHGFGFSTANGSYSNPFYADFLSTPGYLEFFSTPPTYSELPVAFSATPVVTPEPKTNALVMVAALSFCWVGWRRSAAAKDPVKGEVRVACSHDK